MNLVKWFRKNNKKVMAVVVVIIMFGFIGGSYIRQLGQRRTGLHKTIAYFADDKKITNYDLVLARQELEILKMLGAGNMLRGSVLPVFRTPDLRAVLLSELLFYERRISAELSRQIKQTIRTGKYNISNKQVNDIYNRSIQSEICWTLLKNEARLAGIRIPKEHAGNLLGRIIPQLAPGTTYSQLIQLLIDRRGIPEEKILTSFAELLAVLEYSTIVCSNENVTTRQTMHNISLENETIDVEFVKFDSAVFAEAENESTQQQISAHFDKYKKFFAGTTSEENPYGFGYKLPDRVQLEYIALKLDDVSQIVTAPTQEQIEEYYQGHREQFTESVLSDPNDPNSPPIERVKSYAEMAGIISQSLLQNKINSKAERILQEAKTLTEAGFENKDIDPAGLSSDQLAQMAGDYKNVSEQLSEKYNIKVYMGRTGLLSAVDIRSNERLRMLYVKGHGLNNPVGLPQIVFAIDELQASELGPFDVPKPRMYENIGPARDIFGKIMALLRVIKAEKAAEPQSIDQTFTKNTLGFEEPDEPAGENVYSVKEKVVEDLKKLAAMETIKSKAQEFIEEATKDGWDTAVEKFNELYGQRPGQNDSQPDAFGNITKDISKPFELENLTGLRRISTQAINTLVTQNTGNPTLQPLISESNKRAKFVNQLYSLLPAGAETLDTVPLIMEFKPEMSCYCLKSLSAKHLEREQYEKIKAMRVYKEDVVQAQSLTTVHLSPENILKRLNFRWVRDAEKATDANMPAEYGGQS